MTDEPAKKRSCLGCLLRGTLILVLLLAVLAAVGAVVVYERSERRVKSAARDLTVASTPELVARGKYLAQVSCQLCHGDDYSGGREFPLGIVNSFAANITQDKATGIGAFTDGQLEEILRRGVRTEHPGQETDGKREKDCRILRPPMPTFASIPDEEVRALIAYLRTIPPVSKPSRAAVVAPVGRLVFGVFAKKPPHEVPTGIAAVPPEQVGEYLANKICLCSECHHPRTQDHQPIPGKLWSGGMPIGDVGELPVLTANISPDEVEGIGTWTKDQFVRAIKTGVNAAGRELDHHMPRYPLTDSDAGAIYDYLKKQAPVRSHVWSSVALAGCELYRRSGCASCHGFDGKGPRADITKLAASGDVAKLKTWIKDPASVKPGTQMPRLGIDDDKDLEALARFVIELAQHGSS
jgi:mono/diheme cytochrome c family protein